MAGPRYRQSHGKRDIISIEIFPTGEVRRGNSLTGKASGRIAVGSVAQHASGQGSIHLPFKRATLPAFASRRCEPDQLASVEPTGLGGHHVDEPDVLRLPVRNPESYGALRIFHIFDCGFSI